MKTFARIEAGAVVELLQAAELPQFHPSLVWAEAPPGAAVGWHFEGGEFSAPEASEASKAVSERAWRDSELASMVWLRDRHRDQLEIGVPTTLTPNQFAELLVFMQALRDWPQSESFPDKAQRPDAPEFLSALEGMQ